MFAVPDLRQYITERLTSAVEDIFVVFEKTIVEYEEQIEHQRRLLDMVYHPEVKLQRTDFQQQHVCEDQEQQDVCVQRKTSSLDQEDPDSAHDKEEELRSSEEGEQLGLKQETAAFKEAAAHQESQHNENQIFNCIENVRSLVEEETSICVSVQSSVVPEANSEQQLLSHNSEDTENQHQEGGKHGDSGSTTVKPKRNSHTKPKSNENISAVPSKAPKGKASLKCPKCEKVYKSRACLMKHVTAHPVEKIFNCKTCGKNFRRKDHLTGHMRIHSGERPFVCKTCGKGFRLECDLKRHIVVHTGERPFTCTTCGGTFKRRSHLNAHMKTHAFEKFPHRFMSQSYPDMYDDDGVYLGSDTEEFL